MTTTSLISQPLARLLTCNRPLTYEVLVFGDETQYPPALDIQVKIDGTVFADPVPFEPYSFENTAGVGAKAEFSFSVSDIVRQHFKDNPILPTVGSAAPVTDASYQCMVTLSISTLYPDTDGILQTVAGTLETKDIRVFNARYDPEHAEDYGEHHIDIASPAGIGTVQPLSAKPSISILSLDDNEFLAYYTDALTHYRVITYDAAGQKLEEGHALISTPTNNDGISVVPVGPVNINNVTAWTIGTVTIDSTVHSYIVQIGVSLAAPGSFWSFGQLHKYFIVPGSCRKHRVHFQGEYGHIESFSIFNSEKIKNVVKSEAYQKALPVAFGISDRGTNRVVSRGTIQISSPIGDLTRLEQRWLATSYANSTRIWIEKDGKYIPVYLKDGSFPYSDSDKPVNELRFTLVYSNDSISQKN